jgi:sugar lactone lactonase YvrE/enterochelin esterase-like enzyme
MRYTTAAAKTMEKLFPMKDMFAAPLLLSCLALFCGFSAVAQNTAPKPPQTEDQPLGSIWELNVPPVSNNYPLTEDSKPHPEVPQGKIFKFTLTNPSAFPETVREITVYVPDQYDGKKPACVYVGLDGLGFKVTTVLDNLIAKHQMPVTIAVGVAPGYVPSRDSKATPRYDRSMEFDSRNPRLAQLILDDVLPAVEKQKTSDGRSILLSKNPDDRAIGGGSTGGIGSFNVAWERPDAFHRVFTSIGTFVGMRGSGGGEQFYVLVRKTEPKPIRIFMQDGAHDVLGMQEMGDWFMSNLTMERALEDAGYDVNHQWGDGTHNGSQAAQIFPDAMRWLWRDWPKPIVAQAPLVKKLQAVVLQGEDWKVALDGCSTGLSLAADANGHVYFPSRSERGISEIKAGATCAEAQPSEAIAFGPEGRLYTAVKGTGLVGYDAAGHSATLATQLEIDSLTVRSNGDLYAAVTNATGEGELWLVHPSGEKIKVAEKIHGASGVALTPDERWIFVAQRNSHQGLSYRVLADGKLDARDPFYDLYQPAWADDAGVGAVAMDTDGRAYVATRMGVQIMDHNGRVTSILPLPGNQAAESVIFGGEDFKSLYVYSGGKVYVRRMKVAGVAPAAAPKDTPAWGAGM